MKCKVIRLSTSLSSGKYYFALDIDGLLLRASDREYSMLAERLTGDIETPHNHPKIEKHFKKIAEEINE